MRAFLTGANGFVGSWLSAHLKEEGDEVIEAHPDLDVRDAEAVAKAVTDAAPEVIYHLAALAHVGLSWSNPSEVFSVNAAGTLNVLEAAKANAKSPRVLLVSSAEVYGRVAIDDLPTNEHARISPVTPYAASKVAAEFLGIQAFNSSALPVIIARPFNHVGPGQSADFAVSAIARRIVEAEASGASTISLGNATPRRDFTDVRDVVKAYRMLVAGADPGLAYNVCSSKDISIKELADKLIELSGVPVTVEIDPALQRITDVPVVRGDSTRIRAATGWIPSVPLDQTLADVLEYWRAELGSVLNA